MSRGQNGRINYNKKIFDLGVEYVSMERGWDHVSSPHPIAFKRGMAWLSHPMKPPMLAIIHSLCFKMVALIPSMMIQIYARIK